MLQNEKELQFSYSQLARMYRLCESIAADNLGDPDTRQDEIEGVRAMIRKIEREVADYLASHSEKAA